MGKLGLLLREGKKRNNQNKPNQNTTIHKKGKKKSKQQNKQ